VLGAWTPAQESQLFRSSADVVPIYATVRSNSGALVPDLTREDFEIRDNGVRRDVVVFSREIVPITVAIMLDVSWSLEQSVLWTRDAGVAFVDNLLPDDRARIATFGQEIAFSPRLTSDKRYLYRVLDEEVWPGGEAPVWETLDRAMTSLAGEPGRRVLLAVTDGQDSVGRTMASARKRIRGVEGLRKVRNRVLDEGFMVYAVGRRKPPAEVSMVFRFDDGLARDLRELAEESGGGYRVVGPSVSAEEAMSQVAEELHHQYLLGFTPTTMDGKVHKLEVKTKRGGMSVQARKSYRAAP
jgi:Ca-activated chloride channel family protein